MRVWGKWPWIFALIELGKLSNWFYSNVYEMKYDTKKYLTVAAIRTQYAQQKYEANVDSKWPS